MNIWYFMLGNQLIYYIPNTKQDLQTLGRPGAFRVFTQNVATFKIHLIFTWAIKPLTVGSKADPISPLRSPYLSPNPTPV